MEQNTATIGDVQQHTDVTVTEEPRDELPTITGNKYFILLPGKTFKPQEDIIRNVLQQISGLQDVSTAEKCDVVLVFCFIVSRAGTDIDAAVNELNGLSESKPAVFMVLHHTFDPEKIIPDSSRYVNRTDTLTVDCLFYEGEFLKCVRNNEALDKIKQRLQPQCLEQNWVYSVIQYIMLWIRSVPGSIWVTEADTEMPKANSSEMDLQFKSSLMLVLLGMSGSEKTAVKHMIFGREESQANTSPAVLKEFTAENGEVDKWRVSVINTPDMLYSELSLEEIKQNKQLCNGQDLPYTFLLVIPAKQFFKEEREIVMKMEKRLEEGCLERLMIVVTVTDKHEKLKTENHKFQKLEEKFGNHFHVLNINETGNRRQVSELLKKAEEMVESSDDFESFEFVNKDELLI